MEPMKAPSKSLLDGDIHVLKFPVMVSPKYDGIRCIIHPELGPVTRSLKPIPNDHIREGLMDCPNPGQYMHYLDGEIITLDENSAIKEFSEISGDVRRRHGKPRWSFRVFDHYQNSEDPFHARLQTAEDNIYNGGSWGTQIVPHVECRCPDDVLSYYRELVDAGWEGIMIRDPGGPYKYGRSTMKQGWLLKYKPWEDDEGVIVRVEELERNTNDAEKDAFGHTKRSTHKSGLVRANLAGTLVLSTERWGQVRVAVQTSKDREDLWHRRNEIEGLSCTFKYQKVGSKDKPRFAQFKSIRCPE